MSATDIGSMPRRLAWAVAGLVLVAAIALVDSRTGYEYSVSLLYVGPIALVTWFGGRWPGVFLSLTSAFAAWLADLETGRLSAPLAVHAWNVAISFGFFLIVTLLLSRLRKALARETELAHTDAMTGAVNIRLFFAMLEREIARARRSGEPLTVTYIDIDDFKGVNDRFGHRTGDRVLRGLVEGIKRRVRATDVVARLGGDEFAVLLPATGPEAAEILMADIQRGVREEMRNQGWPVTFSAGALTCLRPPPAVDDLMRAVDELMYAVKKAGKDGVSHSVYAS